MTGFLKKSSTMSWKKEIDELRKREKLAEVMGGPEKLKKQKKNNRLNVRERIEKLIDKEVPKLALPKGFEPAPKYTISRKKRKKNWNIKRKSNKK